MARKASLMSSSPMRRVTRPSASIAPWRTRSTSTGKSRSASVEPYTQPITVLASTNSSKAENDTCSAGDPAPTSTAVPPRRTDAKAVRMVSARPTTSKPKSAPRPSGVGAHRRHRVLGRRVHDRGGSHGLGQLELGGHLVDGHDGGGAGQAGSLDHRQPHAATADDGHRGRRASRARCSTPRPRRWPARTRPARRAPRGPTGRRAPPPLRGRGSPRRRWRCRARARAAFRRTVA